MLLDPVHFNARAAQVWGSKKPLIIGLCALLGFFLRSQTAHAGVTVVWQRPDSEQVLQSLSPGEGLGGFKQATARDKGKQWKGAVLSSVLEKAMEKLTPENRSQIDLVVLKGEGGRQVWIPRSFVTKVPMVVVSESSGLRSVVPGDGKMRPATDELPWGAYGLQGITRVELTNYQDRLGGFLLKRRTDPAAMRGEKVFMQNCLACHADASAAWRTMGAGFTPKLEAQVQRHPSVPGIKSLDERNARALVSYWNAWVAEQGQSESGAKQASNR